MAITEGTYSQGTQEEHGTVSLTGGQSVDILVEYTNTKPPEGAEADRSQPALMRGVVGFHSISSFPHTLMPISQAHWRMRED